MIESRPYKDPCVITAQVLSVIGLCLSFFFFGGWWISLGLALPAMIMLQTVCCCAMNKCGLIAAGVLSTVAAGWVLIAGIILIVTLEEAKDDCDGSSYYYSYDYCMDSYSGYTAYIVLSVIGGIMWLVAGILVFIFACGQRYETAIEKLKEENGQPSQPAVATTTDPEAVAAEPVPATTTTTITNLPDGSVEKKTEVVNPDGSKTVTVTVESPSE